MNHHNINKNNDEDAEDAEEAEEDENSVEYWKSKYNDLNREYDEFRNESAEFEHELESQLKHSEERIKDLENKNNRFIFDNEALKNKLNEFNITTHKQILQLQEELAIVKGVNDNMQKHIRELEQKNDDLERTNRCAMFSLDEFEYKINQALERNAILESELDEKDELAETVQRLRDESRELRQELAVRQKKQQEFILNNNNLPLTPPLTSPNINNDLLFKQDLNIVASAAESSGAAASISTNYDILMNNLDNNNNNNNCTITQSQQTKSSSRISALNYVGDVLRKITSMESKLLASRSLMNKEPTSRERRSITISSFNNKSSR